MNKYIRWIKLCLPFVSLAVNEIEAIGGDKTHKTVVAIQYVESVLDAIVNGGTIPPAPDALK